MGSYSFDLSKDNKSVFIQNDIIHAPELISKAIPIVKKDSKFAIVPIVILIQDPKFSPNLKASSMEILEKVLMKMDNVSNNWEIASIPCCTFISTEEIVQKYKKYYKFLEELKTKRKIFQEKTTKNNNATKANNVNIKVLAKYRDLIRTNEKIQEGLEEYYESVLSEQKQKAISMPVDISKQVTHRIIIIQDESAHAKTKYSPAFPIQKNPVRWHL